MPLKRTETALETQNAPEAERAEPKTDRASETITSAPLAPRCISEGCISFGDRAPPWCWLCNGEPNPHVNISRQEAAQRLIPSYFDRAPSDALTALDIREAKLDREPWSGDIHPEIKYAVLVQVMRSIRDDQIGACSTVRALAAEALAKVGA